MRPTHTLTWKLSKKSWDSVASAVRVERTKHQNCGGTSRLTKNGDEFKMEADGATAEMFIAALKKLLQPVIDKDYPGALGELFGSGPFGGLF